MNFLTEMRYKIKWKKLALDESPLTRVGRKMSSLEVENRISEDIISKLELENATNLLDIGCGSGIVANKLISFSDHANFHHTLVDLPETILALKAHCEYLKLNQSKLHFVSGDLRKELTRLSKRHYDRILVYSVLHYFKKPEKIIAELLQLLEIGGICLLGDLPNPDKKRRSLKLTSGLLRQIWRRWNFETFGDDFMNHLILKFEQDGFRVTLLEQPKDLPFSNSRLDVKIRRIR